MSRKKIFQAIEEHAQQALSSASFIRELGEDHDFALSEKKKLDKSVAALGELHRKLEEAVPGHDDHVIWERGYFAGRRDKRNGMHHDQRKNPYK